MGPVNYLKNRLFYASIFILAYFFINPINFNFSPAFAKTSGKNQSAFINMTYEKGVKAFKKGDFGQAIFYWEMVEKYYKSHANTGQQIETLIKIADAYESLGQPIEAVKNLNNAAKLVNNGKNTLKRGKIMSHMGQVYQSLGQSDIAAEYLNAALKIAKKENDMEMKLAVLNDLGNLYFAGNDYEKAGQYYEKSIKTAGNINKPGLAIGPQINLSRLEIKKENFKKSALLLKKSLLHIKNMEDGHKKAYFLIAIGKLFNRIPYGDPAQSLELFDKAAEIAKKTEDNTALSYAFGEKGALYEKQGDYKKALGITRKAVFEAQKSNSTKSLYKWQWQTGRILKKTGDMDGAISSYRLAVYSLQTIRQNLSMGCKKGNCMSFKQIIKPLYFDMADLLLRRSKIKGRPYKDVQKDLIEARDTIEKLKAAELQDYFQDECITRLKTKSLSPDQIDANTVVIYPVLLPDRIELLVGFSGNMKQFTVNVEKNKLTRIIRLFRIKLESPESRFMRYARKLYKWIIKPLEPDLKAKEIDTIVFVPDGALRTIPISALNDGRRFLVEKYAIVTTPGLTLTDPKPMSRKNLKLLLNGLTESVQGFNPLPNVSSELEKVGELYKSKVLKNQNFTISKVETQLKQTPYSVVHIASHGQFDRDLNNTFLLAYDGKLTMDILEKVMNISRFRDKPVELLTLSACQTALGDDRAALGLAGVALKAGARSAIATLWFIDDKTTSQLISEFYKQLKNPMLTKAQALQQAQLKMIHIPSSSHPAYWAPFLLIGNWM